MPEAAATLRFRPVTDDNRADFEALFTGRGGPKHCWCMVWRATPAELRNVSGPARREQMLGRIAAGTPVGLLAYEDGQPVGWVSVAPKPTFRSLGGPDPKPGENVWSLTCMFLTRRLRKSGYAHAFIAAACDRARDAGASAIEAYPVLPDSPSYRFMGFVSAFEKAGFTHLGMAGTRRHVMRRTL